MTTTALPDAATAGAARLRTVLRLDAAACAAFGVLFTAGAAPVDRLLGLPPVWALPIGVYLLGCTAALLLVAAYPDLVRGQVIGVVANNALAAAAFAALPFTGLMDLTAAGFAVLLGGAALVVLITAVEAAGVRHLR